MHFYRVFKYLFRARLGYHVDQTASQLVADRCLAKINALGDREPLTPRQRSDLIGGLGEALRLAPWSASLHLLLANLHEQDNPTESEALVNESLRLNWAEAGAHRLLSRLLVPGDPHGAVIESDISYLLEAGLELEAADRLYAGQAERRAAQHLC